MAAGDGTALKELFTRHTPWLAARLRAALPASDVQDVLQETFLGRGTALAVIGQRARRKPGCGVSPGAKPRCGSGARVQPHRWSVAGTWPSPVWSSWPARGYLGCGQRRCRDLLPLPPGPVHGPGDVPGRPDLGPGGSPGAARRRATEGCAGQRRPLPSAVWSSLGRQWAWRALAAWTRRA